MEEQHEDHGHSIAAWALVAIIVVGALIGAIAVLVPSIVLGIISAIVIILGAITGKVLSMAGYGAAAHDTEGGGFLVDAPDETGTSTVGKS